MCGRFTLASLREFVKGLEWVAHPEEDLFSPRYNVAPGQNVAAVTNQAGSDDAAGPATVQSLHWGLVPSWAKDVKIGYRMINARAETLRTSNAFARALQRRRCLIPADGFYEWKAVERGLKQPHLFRRQDGRPFALAGLWESWRDDDGHTLRSCTVITTRPNELVKQVHDRMPVILGEADYKHWLEWEDAEKLQSLLVPFPADRMDVRRVGTAVNKPANDDASLVEPVEDDPPPTQPSLFG
ncbi:MAG: SOS response-associated peptidase [Phycisphaerae bacterium]